MAPVACLAAVFALAACAAAQNPDDFIVNPNPNAAAATPTASATTAIARAQTVTVTTTATITQASSATPAITAVSDCHPHGTVKSVNTVHTNPKEV